MATKSLTGRVALVTGAGTPIGLGRHIALALAREGARVAMLDINESGLEQASADVAGSAPVVIVNEVMAAQYWPRVGPVGQRMRVGVNGPWHRIVGVARTAKYRDVAEAPQPFLYVPLAHALGGPGLGEVRLVVRTERAPVAITAAIRNALQSIDVGLPVFNVVTWAQHFDYLLRPQRMGMTLLGAMSAVALGGDRSIIR